MAIHCKKLSSDLSRLMARDNLLVLFHKEVLCFASSLNIIGAWAEDKKGASCDLTLNGWGKRMLEMAASLGGRSCFF